MSISFDDVRVTFCNAHSRLNKSHGVSHNRRHFSQCAIFEAKKAKEEEEMCLKVKCARFVTLHELIRLHNVFHIHISREKEKKYSCAVLYFRSTSSLETLDYCWPKNLNSTRNSSTTKNSFLNPRPYTCVRCFFCVLLISFKGSSFSI